MTLATELSVRSFAFWYLLVAIKAQLRYVHDNSSQTIQITITLTTIMAISFQ